MNDISERALWPRYMAVYQDIVRHTSTALAPWYVVPADHKWFARVVIGSAIVGALEALDLQFPRADKASLREFKQVREALENEGEGRRKKKAKKSAGRKVGELSGRRHTLCLEFDVGSDGAQAARVIARSAILPGLRGGLLHAAIRSRSSPAVSPLKPGYRCLGRRFRRRAQLGFRASPLRLAKS